MKAILLLFLLKSVCSFGQHVVLSSDSTKLIFPNDVAIPMHVMHEGKQFLVSHTAVKTILVQCNYLYDRLTHLSKTTELYQRENATLDSIIQVHGNKSTALQERTEVYSDAYRQSSSVSAEYDKQIRSMIADASRLQKQNRRDRRKFFLKGIVSGFAGGALIAILYVSTSD
jgi:hypothetical protein